MALILRVRRFDGPGRWWWALTNANDEFLADHEVSLDQSSWQYEAFTDAYGYLRKHAAPDRRTVSEAEILARLGRWIGTEVFGPVGEALAARAPVSVRVVIPESARVLAYRPLELARVGERTLAMTQVGLAMQVETGARAPARTKTATTDHLRMLGLFSLPTGASVLNLRRERHGLTRLVEDIGRTQDRSILLRVLQYGVTRDRLRDAIEEVEGWDAIHISAHGLSGGILLENEDGTPDLVSGRDLVDLLSAAADQVQLVTVSSCLSAAITVAEHRRLLGLGGAILPETQLPQVPSLPAESGSGQVMPALAAELAERLDVAVIGMRFPVTDEFAVDLSAELYRQLLGRRQPVARALALAVPKVAADPATPSCPPISSSTPALFGPRAIDAALHAPPGKPVVFDEHQVRKMAQFRKQPKRFVGRSTMLTEASQLLAPGSRRSGLLLHGMAGVGKTASVLELAYVHRERFRAMVWYQAPAEGGHIADALSDLAERLETALPGLALRHRLDSAQELARFLPTLTEFCRTERVLFVLDNLESLHTKDGVWRDERWGQVIGALAGHHGLSRVLLTSRQLIAGLDDRVIAYPVKPLSPDEALLLARELPHLRALIDGTVPDLTIDDGRRLAVRVLRTAQGHPTLLEWADRQAAEPARLASLRARLTEADQTWNETGIRLEDFFDTDRADANADDYLRVLDAWTKGVVGSLPGDAARLFTLLCLLEDGDRLQPVVDGIWTAWHELGGSEVPDLKPALASLTSNGLMTVDPFPDGDIVIYHMHPAVAAAGHALAGPALRANIDRIAADGWLSSVRAAVAHEHDDSSNWLVRTGWLVRKAARGAVPYLLRLGDWRNALPMLELLLARDHSVDTLRATLPAARAVAELARGTDGETSAQRLLVSILLSVDPPAGEKLALAAPTEPGPRRDSHTSSMTYNLANYYRASGRLVESLAMLDDLLGRECGPWTRLALLADRVLRQVELHQEIDAIEKMRQLREESSKLTESEIQGESFQPWQVRETLLWVSASVAIHAERWQEALDHKDALHELERRRDAPAGHMAITRLGRYGPLLKLGRIEDAYEVLAECREVFERVGDTRHIGKVHSGLSNVEDARGHSDTAIGHMLTALRYSYMTGDVADVADKHIELGRLLFVHARDVSGGYLHTLVGVFLGTLIGRTLRPESLSLLAPALRLVSAVPATLDAAREEAENVDGVRLGQLLTLHLPEADMPEQAFDDVLDAVVAAAAKHDPEMAQHLVNWEPIISGVVASANGDQQAAQVVDLALRGIESQTTTWKTLAAAFRRIQAGQRDKGLLAGDGLDVAIIRRTLAGLADPSLVPSNLWPLASLGVHLGSLVRALKEGNSDQARAVADEIAATEHGRDPGLSAVLEATIAAGPDRVVVAGQNPVIESLIATLRHYLTPESENEWPIAMS